MTTTPWRADISDDGGFAIYDAEGKCLCTRGPWPSRAAESIANGHLMGAAPELLQMTKLLERSVLYQIGRDEESGDHEGAGMKRITLYMVRAALARATHTGAGE